MYLIFACTGYILAFLLVLLFNKSNLKLVLKLFISSLISLLFMYLGSRLFGIISYSFYLKSINDYSFIKSIKNSGLVFYGGLIFYSLGFYLIGRLIKINGSKLLETLAYTCPSFHMIARIGCFYTGCCYGLIVDNNIVNSPIGIVCKATNSIATKRIPVQLIEAGLLLVILIVVLIKIQIEKEDKKVFETYLFSYAIIRFCLEFLRGDSIRGYIGIFSFSQWISIMIIIGLLVIKIIKFIKERRKVFE